MKVRMLMAGTFVAVVAAGSGCGVVSSLTDGVSDPMTPEQSRAQVVDAARDIVQTAGLRVVSATFKRTSCNDQAEPPFRGEVQIDYAHGTYEESQAEIERMLQQLRGSGWSGDSDFKSHGAVLQKNNVDARFIAYSPNDKVGGITLFGECRDVTTQQNSMPVPVSASELQ